jgi:hypothetical protein
MSIAEVTLAIGPRGVAHCLLLHTGGSRQRVRRES